MASINLHQGPKGRNQITSKGFVGQLPLMGLIGVSAALVYLVVRVLPGSARLKEVRCRRKMPTVTRLGQYRMACEARIMPITSKLPDNSKGIGRCFWEVALCQDVPVVHREVAGRADHT